MRFAELIERLPPEGGICFDGRRVSTPRILALSRQAARQLHGRGVRPGDRVACMLDNGLPFMVAWFGSALLGAQFVPVNTRLIGDTLHYILRDSGSKVVIAESAYVEERQLAVHHSGMEVIVSEAWMSSLADIDPSWATSDQGGGCIIYTSGTTGRPKGVSWLSETQAEQATSYARELVPLTAGENAFSCLPLFHVTCIGVTMASLLQGATVHIDQRFSASNFWQRLRETEAVFFPYVGSILSILLKDNREPESHSVRFAMGAAAPMDIFLEFQERFALRLLETWGQTEMGSVWLANHDQVPGSIGKSCPRADFRISPVEETVRGGELQVRPHNRVSMMRGYHGEESSTSGDWDGQWYRTRDLVTIDAAGNYFFVGRLADCLRRRGENVSAYEVEQIILKCGHIAEAAIVGVKSDLAEEDIALYYIERENGCLSPEALEVWCRANLSDFMVPRYYCSVSAFPKTETQRTQKGILHAEVQLKGAYDSERRAT